MPDADARVLLDELTLEEGDEEDVGEGEDTEEDADNQSSETARAQTFEAVGRFDSQEDGDDQGRAGYVDGDEAEGPLEAVAALKDAVLEGGEDDGREASSDTRGDTPRRGNLAHTALLPAPGDASLAGEADTDQSTDDCLRRRDREAEGGGNEEPDSVASLCAAHRQHQWVDSQTDRYR